MNTIQLKLYATRFLLGVALMLAVVGVVVSVRAFVGGEPLVVVEHIEYATLGGDSSVPGEALGSARNPTRFDYLEVDDNAQFDGTVAVTGAFTGSAAGTFASGLTVTAGDTNVDNFVQGGDTATIPSATTTYTLSAAELCDNSAIFVNPSGGVLTLTLPSTTTLYADCLGSNGDSRDLLFVNNSSVTSSVFAAGGATFIYGTSSSTIGASSAAFLNLYRTTDSIYTLQITNLSVQ